MLRASTGILIVAVGVQIAIAGALAGVRPYWDILPPVPSDQTLAASSFGDAQFLYRSLVMDLQNFGDTGGRLTPLRDYDMAHVVRWLEALDKLDLHADHHVVLAARYFSLTQDTPSLAYLVRYLQSHVDKDPRRKMMWLTEALFMAQVQLKDRDLTLDIARQLEGYDFPEMTLIAYQLPAVIYEKLADYQRAAAAMERAERLTEGRSTPAEQQFMADYVAEMRAKGEPQGDPLVRP